MKALALVGIGLLLAACDTGGAERAAVRVNGSAITQTQWDVAVEDLERATGVQLDDAGRRKVLESLVQSRLMANAATGLLDEAGIADINAQAALHRERLLVKEYLRRTADPAPVTEERVRAYYAQHPQAFGADEVRHFELLTTETAPSSSERKPVLDALDALHENNDWQKRPVIEGVRWVHRLETSGNSALDGRLRSAAAELKQGETSAPLFIDGRPYLLRITRIETREPRPLEEVRPDIQRRLQIEQLQQAVDQAGQELLSQAEVEYLVPMNDNE